MFGIKGKLVSTKQKVFGLVRLISNSKNEDLGGSSHNAIFAATTYEPVNLLTNYALEAELKKAEALLHCRLTDRPK